MGQLAAGILVPAVPPGDQETPEDQAVPGNQDEVHHHGISVSHHPDVRLSKKDRMATMDQNR